MKFIKGVPMATPSIALSLAALGNITPYGEGIRYACGIMSFLALLIFFLKIVLDWPHAREELKTPIPLSVLPTATMAIMLLCTYIATYVPNIALVIWCVALAAHILVMLIFCKKFLIGFKLGSVFPSWFIVGVGIVAASVTAPVTGVVAIGQAVFYVGLVLYLALLPPVTLRMAKVKTFPEPARKTIAIFTAPSSLLVVGYFNSFAGETRPLLVYALLAIATISYIYTLAMMPKLLKIKFYPTYAAFAFPFVISATAFRLGANFIAYRHGFYFLNNIATMAMWLAVLIVNFVIVHYVRYFKFWMQF